MSRQTFINEIEHNLKKTATKRFNLYMNAKINKIK